MLIKCENSFLLINIVKIKCCLIELIKFKSHNTDVISVIFFKS